MLELGWKTVEYVNVNILINNLAGDISCWAAVVFTTSHTTQKVKLVKLE